MQKEIFHERLVRATGRSVDYARQMVRNRLPDSFLYLVHLNSSYDGNSLEAGERVFPDDVARHGACVGPASTERVVELLWRDGLVPEWIDIAVSRADSAHTFMELLCCGRFTDQSEHLYYAKTDVCPFGCKSPYLPPDWEPGNESFDLDWRLSREA